MPGYQGFYGRTYISDPKPLVGGRSGHGRDQEVMHTEEEAFIYLHTSFAVDSSKLLVEVVVTRTQDHYS